MERPKYKYKGLIMIFLSFICLHFTEAQNTYRKTIYNAYISGDMATWVAVIQKMEKNSELKTFDQKLELVNYYYGYIGYLLGLKKYEQAENYILKGNILLDQLLKSDKNNATVNAYKSAFIGFKIALSKFKAITLGPESASFINKAFETDKNNIQAIVDKANALFYTPNLFGGNKKEAIRLYKIGIQKMEQTRISENNWFYLSVLTTLAKALEKTGKMEDAMAVYKKILTVEPNYQWVKKTLYPELIQKMKK